MCRELARTQSGLTVQIQEAAITEDFLVSPNVDVNDPLKPPGSRIVKLSRTSPPGVNPEPVISCGISDV